MQEFQPIDNNINSISLLVSYTISNHSKKKNEVILSMIQNKQYHHHKVNNNKWSLHYKTMSKESNDKYGIIKVINWYAMIYCVKKIEYGIHSIIASYMEIKMVKFKTKFYYNTNKVEGYKTDEENSPKNDEDPKKRIRKLKINRVLKRQTEKNKNKRKTIIKKIQSNKIK